MIGRHIKQGRGKGPSHGATRKRMRRRKRTLHRKGGRVRGGSRLKRAKNPAEMNALMSSQPQPTGIEEEERR